jgi:hypothetical protein
MSTLYGVFRATGRQHLSFEQKRDLLDARGEKP